MGKVTELNQIISEAEMEKVMDMQYGKSGYKVSIFTNKKGSKYKAIFSGFAEPANNGEFTITGAMTRRWLPTITQEFRQRMETTGDGQTRWNSRELKTTDYREQGESLDEARLSGKDIPKMIKAIKDLDQKTLTRYMAMDKKNIFSKKNLDSMVSDGDLSKDDAKKLGILSIGVGHALASFDATLDANKKNRIARAMERVKEVETM